MRWFVLGCAALVGCNAFPAKLRDEIPLEGSDGGRDGAVEPGDVAVVDATLVTADTGAHRALAVAAGSGGDWLVWSTDSGAPVSYRVRFCRADDCAEPRDFDIQVCDTGHSDTLSGYLASAGSKVVASNVVCPGWVCALDTAGDEPSDVCSFGSDVYRIVGDGAGMFGTTGAGGPPPPEGGLVSFDPAELGSNFKGQQDLDVRNLAEGGAADLAVSASRVHFTVAPDPTSFRVLACPRALANCSEPAEVMGATQGVVSSLAATDDAVFIAHGSGLESQVVRVDIGSREATVLAKGPVTARGLVVVGSYVYWSEDESVFRISRAGGPPVRIGHVPAAVTHLEPSSARDALYALAKNGLYRVALPEK